MTTRKDLEIKCPCCGVEMLIDVNTTKILRHSKEKKPTESLDDVLKKEKERDKDPDKKIESVMGKMKERKNNLDKVFDEAKKKAEEDPSDPTPDPFRWD